MRIGFADFSSLDFHAQSVDSQPLGGTQSAACYLARILARRGHEIFLFTHTSTPGSFAGVKSSMSVYQMPRAADEARHGRMYARCREIEGVEYIGSLPQTLLAGEMRSVMALAYPNKFAETSCIAALEAMASGCAVVTSALGALPETTAGFARLVHFGAERQRYLSDFVEQITEALRAGMRHDAQAEMLLRRQVGYIQANATWEARAIEWEQWLGSKRRRLKYEG